MTAPRPEGFNTYATAQACDRCGRTQFNLWTMDNGKRWCGRCLTAVTISTNVPDPLASGESDD